MKKIIFNLIILVSCFGFIAQSKPNWLQYMNTTKCGWEESRLYNHAVIAEGHPPILSCEYKLNMTNFTFNIQTRKYFCQSYIWYNVDLNKWVESQADIYCPQGSSNSAQQNPPTNYSPPASPAPPVKALIPYVQPPKSAQCVRKINGIDVIMSCN